MWVVRVMKLLSLRGGGQRWVRLATIALLSDLPRPTGDLFRAHVPVVAGGRRRLVKHGMTGSKLVNYVVAEPFVIQSARIKWVHNYHAGPEMAQASLRDPAVLFTLSSVEVIKLMALDCGRGIRSARCIHHELLSQGTKRCFLTVTRLRESIGNLLAYGLALHWGK